MIRIKYWAIRHNSTGFYFPEPSGRSGRGGSFTEPTDFEQSFYQIHRRPRLFRSPEAAQAFLSQWQRGKFRSNGDWDDLDYVICEVPGRDKTQMQIVPITLELPHLYEIPEGTIDNGIQPNRPSRRRNPARQQNVRTWFPCTNA